MAWNVFKIDSSKIGFYQNFLIYCDKFDNKIIYCLSRFRAGNFSLAPTSNCYPVNAYCLTFDFVWWYFVLKKNTIICLDDLD